MGCAERQDGLGARVRISIFPDIVREAEPFHAREDGHDPPGPSSENGLRNTALRAGVALDADYETS